MDMTKLKFAEMSKREVCIQYLLITLGSIIFALGMVLFLIPHRIAPGGISGIAIIINYITGWPAGTTMLAFNIPIFLLGWRILGIHFTIKSLFSSVLIAVFTDIFNEVLHIKMAISDPILAPIFGGVVFGFGLGIVMKMGGGTSGSNTLARIIARCTNLKEGSAIMMMNVFIITGAGFAFHSADVALYACISFYVASLIIDMMVEGMEYARGAFIISERNIEISDAIIYGFERGATAFRGRGLYTHEDRDILFIVVTRKEIHDLIALVKSIDPKAFIVVTPVHEVLGEGFRRRI